MPRITEKGVTPIPKSVQEIDEVLYQWLIQLGLVFPQFSTYTPSLDVANVGAGIYSTQTFTVPGLSTRDIITVNPPALAAGLYLVSYRVSAANTLSLTFYNSTGGGIDPAAQTYMVMACRI